MPEAAEAGPKHSDITGPTMGFGRRIMKSSYAKESESR